MSQSTALALDGLPDGVQQMLVDVVTVASECLVPDVRCIALFGSGAEKRLRATSDVNLIFVLTAFDAAKIDPLRDTLRAAESAIRLASMFVLESELPLAAEAFAGKFADIRRRHLVLWGEDVLAGIEVPRAAAIQRNRQLLLNLVLRMREAYALRSRRDEQAARMVAEQAGPLRSAAAALYELQGESVGQPKAALERFCAGLVRIEGDDWSGLLARMSEARSEAILAPGVAAADLLRLMVLAQHLRVRFDALR
jgi:hypothetical protein